MDIFSKVDALYAISISVSLFSALVIVWAIILLIKNRRLAARHKKRLNRFLIMVSGQSEAILRRKLNSSNESLERIVSLKNKELSKLIAASPGDGADLINLQSEFEKLYPGFTRSINSIIKGITSNEVRLCMLIRLSIGTKEIARLQNVSPDSIIKARYRIRKKIGLSFFRYSCP